MVREGHYYSGWTWGCSCSANLRRWCGADALCSARPNTASKQPGILARWNCPSAVGECRVVIPRPGGQVLALISYEMLPSSHHPVHSGGIILLEIVAVHRTHDRHHRRNTSCSAGFARAALCRSPNPWRHCAFGKYNLGIAAWRTIGRNRQLTSRTTHYTHPVLSLDGLRNTVKVPVKLPTRLAASCNSP